MFVPKSLFQSFLRISLNPDHDNVIDVVLAELKRQGSWNTNRQEIRRLETNLTGLIERQGRLIHLFKLGGIDDAVLLNKKRDFTGDSYCLS